MKPRGIVLFVAGLAVVGTLGVPTLAGDQQDDSSRTLRASLKGIEEPPSISSTGRGTFRATIAEDGTSLTYTLSSCRRTSIWGSGE